MGKIRKKPKRKDNNLKLKLKKKERIFGKLVVSMGKMATNPRLSRMVGNENCGGSYRYMFRDLFIIYLLIGRTLEV